MRLNLDLDALQVETTAMQPAYAGGLNGDEPYALAAQLPGTSIVWDTQTRPLPAPNTIA